MRYREVRAGKVAVSELVDALWRGQVLEPVLAEVLQLELDELSRRGGDEDLPAVADRRDAGGAVHVVSHVALVGDERRPGVETDADVDRARRQRLREPSRGRKSTGSGRKGEEEGVALGVNLDAAFRGARVPDEAAVLGERLGVCLCPE